MNIHINFQLGMGTCKVFLDALTFAWAFIIPFFLNTSKVYSQGYERNNSFLVFSMTKSFLKAINFVDSVQ